tara:strand:- start:1647 stop:1916 length:270 start_codon:yes stop_codon:yes gene_type:complete
MSIKLDKRSENEKYMDLKNEEMMLFYVNTVVKYLVVFPNRETKTYKSLKNIENETCINSSTISKKLKEHGDAIFKTKGDGYIFYIKKIN